MVMGTMLPIAVMNSMLSGPVRESPGCARLPECQVPAPPFASPPVQGRPRLDGSNAAENGGG